MARLSKLIPVVQLINVLKKILTLPRFLMAAVMLSECFGLMTIFIFPITLTLHWSSLSLEKRLEKDLNLKTQYASDIWGDDEKGYVVPFSPHDSKNRSDWEWYVPHHPFLNPNKPGKVQRVLNGASKFHCNSLNNSLLVGSDLLQKLLLVLVRFRKNKYAVSADIEGMFMQVSLLESDQHSLRFLWREDPTSDVSVFQYTRHTFGVKDSPTYAKYALLRTAVDNQDVFPEAAYAVLNNFFMDDYLGSVKNPETALTLSRSLVELLKLGGFNLTRFISNVPNLSLKLNRPKNSAKKSKEILTAAINPETTLHVLGLKWNHVTDTLVVSRGVNREHKDSVTQRSVLSFVSSVFDPIGLVAPYTVRARLILKDIWRLSGQQWDDPLAN